MYECVRCGQVGLEVKDINRVFRKIPIFGQDDDLAFHAQAGGQWLCGTCALDEVPPFRLAEYGYQRVSLANDQTRYLRIEPELRPFAEHWDDIPREYRFSTLEKCESRVREPIIEWIGGKTGQCYLLGESKALAWAVFRMFLRANATATMMPHHGLMVAFREDEEKKRTYHNSRAVLRAKRQAGLLIIENAMGAAMNHGRAEWIAAILDQRNQYGRKTLVTIQPDTREFQRSILARAGHGAVIAVDDWGREFLSVKAG